MEVYLIAPFRCHINFNSSKIRYLEQEFNRFMKLCQEHFNKFQDTSIPIGSVKFMKSNEKINDDLRYNTIHEDSRQIDEPETILITLNIEPYFQNTNNDCKWTLDMDEEKLNITYIDKSAMIRVFDNTVAILEIGLQLEFLAINKKNRYQTLEVFQTWTNQFMQEIIKNTYESILVKLFKNIFSLDKTHGFGFVQDPSGYKAFSDLKGLRSNEDSNRSGRILKEAGNVLWVNRTFYVEDMKADEKKEVAKWLVPTDKEINIDEITNNKSFFLGWGHNLANCSKVGMLNTDAVRALQLCQYFYTVLDCTNNNLTDLIGMSYSAKNTKGLNVNLSHILADINYLMMQFNDLQLNLQGNRQFFLRQLKGRWDFNSITQAIESKVSLLREKIEIINKKITQRAQFGTEIILFLIGGISLIDFFKGINEYGLIVQKGKEVTSDNVFGLLDIAAILQPDSAIWSGIIVLLVLFWAFFHFHKKST